jgi:hypothetical protein
VPLRLSEPLLFGSLALAAPNDDEQYNHRSDAGDNANGCDVHGGSPSI